MIAGKYCNDFQLILKTADIECIKLPARSPNLNAYAERFVKSIKTECLSKFIPLSEKMLRHILTEYTEHYHHERNHQGHGIDNELLFPKEKIKNPGKIKQSERLGGLLNYYYCEAA